MIFATKGSVRFLTLMNTQQQNTMANYGSSLDFPPSGERKGGFHNLGTITHVTDASGNVVNEYNFDAWGRRRNFTDWSYNVAAQTDILPDRGFTGHEYLPWFKLYNMNGRLYDPVVGRFLEPDPVIQDASSTQNLNRYSYALNNPLRYVDPSGNSFKQTMDDWYGEGNYWYRGDAPGRWGDRSGPITGGGPGSGWNGTGLNGMYYDWETNSYRFTGEGNSSVDWGYANNLVSQYGTSIPSNADLSSINFGRKNDVGGVWFLQDAFGGCGGVMVYKETRWRFIPSTGRAQIGGGANAWDYISNGASVASGYPTIRGTWAYNTSGDVAWTGKNGNYYKLSQVKNNGGYVKSMNYAKNASRLTRGLGNGLTGLSVFASGVSTYMAVSNGTDNTSTWVNLGIGVGGAALTIFGAPVVVTGAAIGGAVWGIGQLVAGDEINGWIDNNFGY